MCASEADLRAIGESLCEGRPPALRALLRKLRRRGTPGELAAALAASAEVSRGLLAARERASASPAHAAAIRLFCNVSKAGRRKQAQPA